MVRSKVMACLLVGLIASAAVAGPLSATAGQKWRKGQLANTPLGKLISGNIGRLLVLRSELNVTDEQRAKIREVLVSNKTKIAKVAKAVRDKKCALRDAVLADKPDEKAIRKAADELGKTIGDAAVGVSKLKAQIAPILTDQQRELIKKTRSECDNAVEKFFAEVLKAE